jgi:hypothetical protein
VDVDGQELVAPVVFDWPAGARHRIGTDAQQGDGETERFTFLGWSDSGAREHEITVPSTPLQVVAQFEQAYFVDVVTDRGAFTGEGWYPKGTKATVSMDTVANATADARHRFKGWTGTGAGSVTSGAASIQMTVQGPVTERASWEAQVRVQASVFPAGVPGASVRVTPAMAWYPLGTQVTLRATAANAEHPFLNWSGSVTSTDNPLVLLVAKPLSIRGRFWVPDDPPVIARMADFLLREDEIQTLTFDWLRQYVSDPNDALETLLFDFTGPAHVTFAVDFNKGTITVKPAPDWNGTESAVITVTDPYGMSDTDTVSVRVISVEDPPDRFGLVAPLQDTTFLSWDAPARFRWRRAHDPDPGDGVNYSLILSRAADLKGPGTLKMTFLPDTTLLVAPQPEGDYYWGVLAQDTEGNTTLCETVYKFRFNASGIRNRTGVPDRYALEQNYPNPFNPVTAVPYQIPRPGRVTVRVIDTRGRTVRTLEDGFRAAGFHEVLWDGRDERGNPAATGVYSVRMEAGDFSRQVKVVLMK